MINISKFIDEANMLTITGMNEFIEYMKSGQLEKDFFESGEFQKGEILELLEKIMDAGDVADEIATKLIYRGITGSASS